MNRKILVSAIVALVLFAVSWLAFHKRNESTRFRVAIVSTVEIEPIAQLRTGFKDEFLRSEFARARSVEFEEYNAQGDSGLINQIADKVASERPNLVYVLGTPAAQAIQKRAPTILLVQGAVTDPIEAGLAASWTGSGRNYVATSDLPPIATQMDLIHHLSPSARRLGVIYNPGESNSVSVISRVRDYLKSNHLLELIEKPIATSSDVPTVLAALQGHVDALYLPPDNTAHAAIPVIGRFCMDNNLPFYATAKSALDDGALATLSLDFVQLGRESAQLALQVLAGKNPRAMPIEVNRSPSISINASVARKLRIDVSNYRDKPNVTIVSSSANE
jgi:putative ABC transport system substrate-binding protein